MKHNIAKSTNRNIYSLNIQYTTNELTQTSVLIVNDLFFALLPKTWITHYNCPFQDTSSFYNTYPNPAIKYSMNKRFPHGRIYCISFIFCILHINVAHSVCQRDIISTISHQCGLLIYLRRTYSQSCCVLMCCKIYGYMKNKNFQ